MMYDIIIVWAGAAWLFAWINSDKKLNKLILEKMPKPWMKVLLSWWERANVSNMDIEVERDYFGQNKKALISIFSRFNQWDIMSYFSSVWINIVEEDRWRLILESWDSRELLDCLLKEAKINNCELKLNSEVVRIIEDNDIYNIELLDWKKYKTKNVIVSSGWKSFFQVWTTGDWYNFAKDLWLKLIPPHRSLCGLTTKKDLSSLSWSSCDLGLRLVDKKIIPPLSGTPFEKGRYKWNMTIYSESWPFLFTHFWISWPIVFNASTVLWEYLNSLKLISEEDKIKYILENIKIELDIKKEKTTKKIYSFFREEIDNEESIEFWLQDWRSWKEAKATWGWVDINELDNNLQSKKYKWLYFIWEVVDITWKTGWFNLQWAWSSAYVAWKNIKK